MSKLQLKYKNPVRTTANVINKVAKVFIKKKPTSKGNGYPAPNKRILKRRIG